MEILQGHEVEKHMLESNDKAGALVRIYAVYRIGFV